MCCPRHYLAIVCWICSYSTFELETNSPQFDKGYDSGRPETQFCEGIFRRRSQGSSNSTETQMHLFEKIYPSFDILFVTPTYYVSWWLWRFAHLQLWALNKFSQMQILARYSVCDTHLFLSNRLRNSNQPCGLHPGQKIFALIFHYSMSYFLDFFWKNCICNNKALRLERYFPCFPTRYKGGPFCS